jgi:hypothetical protein
MTYVDDAFAKCKSMLEITATEQNFASSKHADIRSVVRSSWQLDDDFLTGSYRRNTKTKKLKDVDIFVVIDPAGPQAHLRDEHPSTVLAELRKVLQTKYSNVVADGFACTIKFSDEDDRRGRHRQHDVRDRAGRSGGPGLRQLLRVALRRRRPLPGVHGVVCEASAAGMTALASPEPTCIESPARRVGAAGWGATRSGARSARSGR